MNGVHRSPVNNVNGHGTPDDQSLGLPGVDQEKLISRLYSYAPKQVGINTKALKFNRLTPAQRITRAKPTQAKLEPLVSNLNKAKKKNCLFALS